MTFRRTALFIVVVSMLCVQVVEAGELMVHDAWIMLPPPNSNAAAFMKVSNHTDEAVVLVGVKSPVADRVEIHQSVTAEGVTRMEKLEMISIPAGETLVLAPKGIHVMLFEPAALAEGSPVPMELEFKSGQRVSTTADVQRRGPAKHSGGGPHSHH